MGARILGAVCALLWQIEIAYAEPIENTVSCSGTTGPVAIRYGDSTVDCAIDPATDLDAFVFSASGMDNMRFIVQSLSGSFDPSIEVRGPDQVVILQDSCNGGFSGGLCSIETEVIAAASGEHSITIFDTASNEPGDYVLQLELLPSATPERLDYDITQSGSISPATDVDFYQFSGVEGSTVRFSVLSTAGSFDPRMQVWDPSGTRIDEASCNGGFSGGICSFTLEFDPPVSGEYTLGISDLASNESGGYEFTLQCLTLNCDTQAPSTFLVAAVLPGSRSPAVGETATAFATIINAGSNTGLSCSIAPATPIPADFSYQTTDSNNELTGVLNTPVNIPAGQGQTFLFAITPTAPIAPTEVQFSFDCTNSDPAPVTQGVNTFLLSSQVVATPDVIAVAVTPTSNGHLELPSPAASGAFSIATFNLGASGFVTVAAEPSDSALPLDVFVCRTDPASGFCVDGPAASVGQVMGNNTSATFSAFATARGEIAFDPANTRVFVRFRDDSGELRGATSVAVSALPATLLDTQISSMPASLTNQTTADFEFTATDPSATFECSLDGANFSSCVSPVSFAGLTEGAHGLVVRAVNAVGPDATPATFAWTVDVTPPLVSVTSAPVNPSSSPDATFEFESNEPNSSFTCSLDGGAGTSCSSPINYAGLAAGEHLFTVNAQDPAGNASVAVTSVAWSINSALIDTVIASGPASPTNQTGATFELVASLSGASFQCELDGGGFASCGSTTAYSALGAGAHTFSARAVDATVGADPSPATFNWVIDLSSPQVTAPAAISVQAQDANGSAATDTDIQAFLAGAQASDSVSGDLTAAITQDAPAVFPIGITTVTFSVVDEAGNQGSASSTVEVLADATPPVVSSVVINSNALYAISVQELSTRFSGTDEVGITGYLVTEHDVSDSSNVIPPRTPPALDDGRWVAISPVLNLDTTQQITLANDYAQGAEVELCVWLRDAQGNLSDRLCDTITYGVDWENGIGNWSADNGLWQVGAPSVGPASCFSGSQCVGTVLDGNYPANTDSRLVSPSIQLPTTGPAEELQLRFSHWFSYFNDTDRGQVQVSVFDPATSTFGAWESAGNAIANASGWSLHGVDLTAYSGSIIRIGLLHSSSAFNVGAGWYVDELRIETFVPALVGDFESGWAGWTSDRGLWQVGAATVGPAACFAGNQCAGTELDSNYPANTDSRLVSPTIQLPAAGAGEEVHLRFYQWFSYFNDTDNGQVQVSVRDPITNSFGAWVSEGGSVANVSGWSLKDVDLTSYAGQTVRIALLHSSSAFNVGAGWYVDNVSIVSSTPQFSGSFESGLAGWSADRGLWQVGAPSNVGPASCIAGSQCMGTILDGNYPANTDSRLVSPTLQLPAVSGSEEIHLRFQQWFSFFNDTDNGQVQVAVFDSGSGRFGAWVSESRSVANVSGWSTKDVDLTGYSGQTVRIAFLHSSSAFNVGSGWYIDDVSVTSGVPQFTGSFEGGIGEWSADRGLWQVGAPANVGPANCIEGSQCMGTILDGNYPANTDSRLVSPTIVMPTVNGAEQIRVRFQHWFSFFADTDNGQVQISEFDPATGSFGDWVSEGTSVTNSSGWSLRDVNLTAYAGKTVRIAFLHSSSAFNVNAGWYVDDVSVSVF